MAVNLVETSEIGQFFLRQTEGDEQLAAWLDCALKPSLLRREKNAEPLKRLPPDAPPWLHKKWQSGETFHRFRPDDELVNKVAHIVDWLETARADGAPFLKRTDDKGVPLKIRNLSLEAAFNAANKYFERRPREQAPLDAFGSVKTVMEFRNGTRMVELKTAAALATEGKNMGNCLGTYIEDFYAHRKWRFFSLRDAKGRSHVTLATTEENVMSECKGRQGRPPAEKYLPDIVAFLNANDFRIRQSSFDLPGYFSVTPHTPIFHVSTPPDGCAIVDSLTIKNHPSYFEPQRITFVMGDARIESCPNMNRLYGHMLPFVDGDLTVKDCYALKEMHLHFRVNGETLVDSCGIEKLSVNNRVNTVILRNCWKLKELDVDHRVDGYLLIADCESLVLPRQLKVNDWLIYDKMKRQTHVPGDLDLEGGLAVRESPEVVSIGDNIKTTGSVFLKNLPNLKALPRGLKTGGALTLVNCGIEEIPDDIEIGTDLVIRDCPNLRRIGGPLAINGDLEIEDCPKLSALPAYPAPPKLGVRIFRCPMLGAVLPPQFHGCPNINTDMFLTEALSMM